jgi:hypothetical protein
VSRAAPVPTTVEVLANTLLGMDSGAPGLPAPTHGVTAAFDEVLIRALSRPPCVVSFSGGRDSSAVLALATDTARRHGLDLPVPVTMRFPGVAAADERHWQQLVLDHLGLDNHHVVEPGADLDILGPASTAVLRRHGLRWPGNAYMHKPVIDVARGGTLLTGIGGDELFDTRAPRRRLRAAALGALPARARAAWWLRRREPPAYPWLTPAAHSLVWRALIRDEAAWPYRWDRALHHWHRTRTFSATRTAVALVAEGSDVEVINPFIDPHVLAELAPLGGRRGFASRTAAMRQLFSTHLPEPVLERTTKAVFNTPAWGATVREFVASLDESDVDPQLVDVARLRETIAVPEPDFRTVLVVQAAWLRRQPGRQPATASTS